MTVLELEYDFDLKIDKIDSQTAASFNRAEKQWLLNEAQLFLIRKRFKEFELNQKRIDDLSPLVITNEQKPVTAIPSANVYEFKLSNLDNTYMFFVSGRVSVTDPTCETPKIASLKFVQHDDLNYILNDSFNNSDYSEVVFNFGRSSDNSGSSIYMYNNGLTLTTIHLNYIKQPVKISSGDYVYIDGVVLAPNGPELPEHMHPEIVDVAVQIASGIIQHPEYVQLKTAKVFENR